MSKSIDQLNKKIVKVFETNVEGFTVDSNLNTVVCTLSVSLKVSEKHPIFQEIFLRYLVRTTSAGMPEDQQEVKYEDIERTVHSNENLQILTGRLYFNRC
jgi:hypothetical protein